MRRKPDTPRAVLSPPIPPEGAVLSPPIPPEGAPRARSSAWLLLRRQGSLWGVPHSALKELTRGLPPKLKLRSGTTLVADELLKLAANLESHPFPRCARRFYSEEIYGLAVWRKEPVILVQPNAAPPACLSAGAPRSAEPLPADTQNPEMDIHGET